MQSALDNSEAVDAKLHKELEAGRIAGPFGGPPFPNFRVSPLGLVPKKLLGEFRMIHHLSFPKGTSVNDGIPNAETSVRYATVDDAIRLIKQVRAVFWRKLISKMLFALYLLTQPITIF